MLKDKNINFRCTEEQYNEIKKLAEEEGITQRELILRKTLSLMPVEKEEKRIYKQKKKLKSGEEKEYTSKYLSTKTILQPAPPGNLCQSCRSPVTYSKGRIQIGFDGKSSQIIFNTGCKCKEKTFTLEEIAERLNSQE